MENIRSPYKKASEFGFWQMTIRLALLATVFLAGSICLIEIIKGIIALNS